MANEAIEKDTPLAEVRQEPYTLPQGFKWDTLSLDNPQTVYKFKFQFPNSLKKIQCILFVASRVVSTSKRKLRRGR